MVRFVWLLATVIVLAIAPNSSMADPDVDHAHGEGEVLEHSHEHSHQHSNKHSHEHSHVTADDGRHGHSHPDASARAKLPAKRTPPGLIGPSQAKPPELLPGELPLSRHAAGAMLAFFPGSGIGQAAQGRWTDTGWIFTLGELGSMGLFVQQYLNGSEDGLLLASFSVLAFRIGGVADAIIGPKRKNRRIRNRHKLKRVEQEAIRWIVSPTPNGLTAGATFSF